MPLLHPCCTVTCTPVASSSGRASHKNHPFLRFLSQFSDFTRPHFGRKMLFHQKNHIPLHHRRIADSPARDPALQVCLGHKHQVGVIRVGPVRLQQMADVVVNASESGARWHLVVLHALAKARGQVSCGVKAIIRVPADGAGSAPAGCSKASMSCMHLTTQLASTSSSYGHWQRIGLEYSLRSAVALMRELAALILLPLFCHPSSPSIPQRRLLEPVFVFLTSSNSLRGQADLDLYD